MMQEPRGSSRIKIDFAQASDPGRDPNKQVNEDSCGYAETRFGHLCVLCDGMGGHYGGKEASRTAITTIFEMFDQLPLSMPPAQALKQSIEEAGRRVYRLGGPPENRTRPGSTVVAMLLHDRGLDVAHVGDSRAYIIRSNQIYPLTRDHSMVQGMIDAGMLTEETAMGHPDSNKITRALGMKPEVEVELRPDTMELFAGDVLMQSSDGLTDLALGREILGATRQALSSGGVDHACTMLVKMANDRGGHDNITVQMVRISDVAKANTIPDHPQGAAGPASSAHVPAQQPAGPTPPMTPLAPPSAPLETVQMTSPGAPGLGPSYQSNHQPQALPLPPAAAAGPVSTGGMAWAPPVPTTPDPALPPASLAPYGAAPHAAPAFGAPPAPGSNPGQGAPPGTGPTLTEPQPHSQAWGASPYQPPPAAPAAPVQGLAPYRIDATPGGLPLPPPSLRPPPQAGYGAPPAATPMAGPGLGSQMAAFGPPPPTPGAIQTPMGTSAPEPAAKGGLVFLIIGLSAVIAILILVIVWALWLR
ncbi:Protein serine/threonine phosphatase PrpC, regulation of stationary phase [Minicystis rosea]|nr:Protein serine/threonine phosphatase PrpC, regulation of stationary phase [Minicystis rosea]